tara:strand:- start:164 stop:580 length:417 start_codon:yes stop_codon:yes gene_type:complete
MSVSLTPAGLLGDGYQVDTFGEGGHRAYNVGNKRGTGTYTLFTRGNSNAQASGEVIIHGIYSTPSMGRITRYVISGNLGLTQVFNANTSSVPIAGLAWNGNDLEVSNSNSSLYYCVEVILHGVGIDWNHVWGDFPGMS